MRSKNALSKIFKHVIVKIFCISGVCLFDCMDNLKLSPSPGPKPGTARVLKVARRAEQKTKNKTSAREIVCSIICHFREGRCKGHVNFTNRLFRRETRCRGWSRFRLTKTVLAVVKTATQIGSCSVEGLGSGWMQLKPDEDSGADHVKMKKGRAAQGIPGAAYLTHLGSDEGKPGYEGNLINHQWCSVPRSAPLGVIVRSDMQRGSPSRRTDKDAMEAMILVMECGGSLHHQPKEV
ncbi:hypothetical protein B0I37DRAFT_402087 [Chaetomium sp. MPI-CAGE-AT-0009]|nr:hypothetical protein B0I37DRAFT_402087 [Chaetomium sp. MPI-CAGE-AT-0009]